MAKSPQASGKLVLGIDSAWDSATKSAASYRTKYVYPYLLKRKLSVAKLQGSMALRVYFQFEVRRKGVRMITGMGHGSENVFTGDAGQPLLEVGKYAADEVANKIIHLLSCKTAGELGTDVVEKGALAFFGYSKNFTFRPDMPEIFFECDSEIDRGMADGLTAREVHIRVAAVFEDRIDRLAGEDGQAAALLNADLRYLCSPATSGVFGRPNARLRSS